MECFTPSTEHSPSALQYTEDHSNTTHNIFAVGGSCLHFVNNPAPQVGYATQYVPVCEDT